ncbi:MULTISPECIES: HupE/UreJ family protein [unclassified Rhizobium]|uniref:HupE/UreJ family protein n=1 Tax=unclassified Rhizobium TaxID=2613769 RepID=UPI0021F6DE54|nr:MULTISPECIES: HupE/UreJ family protein [unclassified Rhizobium]MCV9943981.1 HupE/UreJ family protein [Rhizobium sp. BT-175]MCW0017546.1 HupE/UreJ family protein [Rhizobium sp. BT-226]
MIRLLIVLWVALTFISGHAHAHDLRPAYLSITESAPAIYAVLWKAPAMGERRLAVYPRLPLSAVEATPHEGAILNDAYIERWTVHAPTGFAGETIAFDGLPESRTDVLLRVERLSGEVSTARLTPANPSWAVPAATGWQQVGATYVWLGIEHILFGVDHLLFVLALILLAGSWKRIAITITAFTVAHSITLGAATLGYLNVPGPPVEAAIALSIVLVAVEIVKSRQAKEANLTARLPWLVAFAFGLLHGLGFAGALSEIGLPHHAIPAALLFFNIGVELGQLAFAATVLATFAILGRLSIRVFRSQHGRAPHAWARVATAYCIGGIAAFWLIERVGGFWA